LGCARQKGQKRKADDAKSGESGSAAAPAAAAAADDASSAKKQKKESKAAEPADPITALVKEMLAGTGGGSGAAAKPAVSLKDLRKAVLKKCVAKPRTDEAKAAASAKLVEVLFSLPLAVRSVLSPWSNSACAVCLIRLPVWFEHCSYFSLGDD
jgi:hypothetical protein